MQADQLERAAPEERDALTVEVEAMFQVIKSLSDYCHSDCPTILKLTRWLRGTNSSTFGGKRAQAYHIAERK